MLNISDSFKAHGMPKTLNMVKTDTKTIPIFNSGDVPKYYSMPYAMLMAYLAWRIEFKSIIYYLYYLKQWDDC